MTDQERKMLKSYLTECLEPRLKTADEHVKKCTGTIEAADKGADVLDAELCRKLRHYYQGQVTAIESAINDFRELFEEDLKEGE